MTPSDPPYLLSLLGPGIAILFTATFVWAWATGDRRNPFLLFIAAAVATPVAAVSLQIFGAAPGIGVTTVASGILLVLASLLGAEGILRRSGLRLGLLPVCLVLLAVGAGLTYFWFVEPNFRMRGYIANGIPAFVFIGTALRVWSANKSRRIDRVLIWLLLIFGIVLLPRTFILTASVPIETQSAFQDGVFWGIANMSSSVFLTAFCLVLLVSVLTERMEELQRDRDLDRLTGILNRRGFEEQADKVFTQPPQGTLSLIICDLDHFKQVNDTYGHPKGDTVLRVFGALLREEGGDATLSARIGGEEFAMLHTGADRDAALALIDRIRSAMGIANFGLPDDAAPITASFGLARYRPGDSYPSLFERADQALYRAKTQGRNRLCLERTGPTAVLLDGTD